MYINFLAPLPVANLTLRTVTTNAIALSWKVDLRSSQDGILVSYKDQNESSNLLTLDADTETYMMTELSPGYIYSINVYAVAGDVQSVAALAKQFTGNPEYTGFRFLGKVIND